MVVARSSREVFDYVPRSDRNLPSAQKTTFHLRRFPTHLAMRARALADSDDLVELVLRAGIAGWSNFQNLAGEQIVAKHQKRVKISGHTLDEALDKDLLEWFDQDLATELLEAIRTGNALTDEDVKN